MGELLSRGFKFLEHKTQLSKLVSIVKQGGILTGDKVPVPPTGAGLGGNRPGQTYFFLGTEAKPDKASMTSRFSHGYDIKTRVANGDLSMGIIIVDIDAMENARFRISSLLG